MYYREGEVTLTTSCEWVGGIGVYLYGGFYYYFYLGERRRATRLFPLKYEWLSLEPLCAVLHLPSSYGT